MYNIAPGSACKHCLLLLQLALLCCTLLQLPAVSAQTPLPDPFCSSDAKPTPALYDLNGQLVPQQLLRRGRVPAQFEANATLIAEGATYSWLYQQIFNLLGWAPCPLSNSATRYPEPVGWKLAAVLNITSTYGGTFKQIPTAAVLRPARGNISRQLVIVIRGAAFAEDRINFDYTQVSGGAYGAGLIHRGYRNASDEIWGDGAAGLQAVLQKYIVKASTGPPITSVLFAGHSMGGGLGTLLAARTQSYLVKECNITTAPAACKFLSAPLRAKPYVSLVAFAACNAGNSVFAADFGRRVNARMVDFAQDRVPKFLTSFFAPPEWPAPASPVSYKRVAGIVQFGAEDMPFQPDVWANINSGVPTGAAAFEKWANEKTYKIAYLGLPSFRGSLYSAGAHICSYRCILSGYVANAGGDRCLLHAADTATLSKASYCGNFPPYAIASIFPTEPAYP